MGSFRVDFYREDDGTKPLGQFIKSLREDLRSKLVVWLKVLEKVGNDAREPFSKHLGDGIFELRCSKEESR